MSGGEGVATAVRAADGTILHATSRAARGKARANVVLVHGWGEHHGRYHELTDLLTRSGFNVWGYDQRGHGWSGGRRGHAPSFDRLVEDLSVVVGHVTASSPSLPLLLIGHSMGGLVVTRALQTRALDPAGACLSAPWLATAEVIPAWKRALARTLLVVYPSLPIPNRQRPERLTRDPARIQAHREDGLVHGWMTPRLFYEVQGAQRLATAAETPLETPTLFIVPGADPVVKGDTTVRFVRRQGGPAARLLEVPGALHEPFNEVDRGACFNQVERFFTDVLRGGGHPPHPTTRDTARTPGDGTAKGQRRRTVLGTNTDRSPYRGTMADRTPRNDEQGTPLVDEQPVDAPEGQGVADADDQARATGWDPEMPADAEGAEDAADGAPEGNLDLATILAERDEMRDRHLRLAADFDNYRRRMETELRMRWDRAQADFVGKLLEPLDDLQRVAASEPETSSIQSIVEGVDLVERKFLRVIDEAGVEILDPVGEPFDPNTMEAMMRVPAPSEEDDDTVERVFQKGCMMKGQLIRPARVSVFKAE